MNFLLINKPAGWTSFDVVAYIRKKARQHCHPEFVSGSLSSHNNKMLKQVQHDKPKRIKIGHAGTLDPFATGLLIVGVGRESTKRLDEFKKLPKTYVATIHLGAVSDTYDRTGTIQDTIHDTHKTIHNNDGDRQLYRDACIVYRVDEFPSKQQISEVLKTFVGEQTQTPPMFSAKKINGVRLYKLARQGKEVERQSSEIEIMDIKILEYCYPTLKIEVECSAGTYIRSLAHDIGQKLEVGAYCEELVRTRIGEFKLEDAKTPQGI